MGYRSPDEAIAHQYYLGEGVATPDLATGKDFVRFHVSISRGRIGGKPIADSVNTFAEWLFAGFNRVTGTPTDYYERSELYSLRSSDSSDLNCSNLICS